MINALFQRFLTVSLVLACVVHFDAATASPIKTPNSTNPLVKLLRTRPQLTDSVKRVADTLSITQGPPAANLAHMYQISRMKPTPLTGVAPVGMKVALGLVVSPDLIAAQRASLSDSELVGEQRVNTLESWSRKLDQDAQAMEMLAGIRAEENLAHPQAIEAMDRALNRLFDKADPTSKTENLLSFAEVDASDRNEVPAQAYLASHGISAKLMTPGTRLVVLPARAFYEGNAVAGVSSPNILTQLGSNEPMLFVLDFKDAFGAFRFAIPRLIAGPHGITYPAWIVRAYNVFGHLLDGKNEGILGSYHDVPAREFTLTGRGRGIRAVQFNSDNGRFAAFSGVLLDSLTLIP